MFFLLPHNFKRFADIIIVLIVFIVFGLFLLLICPFFLKFRAFYDKNLKRVFFAVNLDGFPIFGGYIERITEGFAIHLSAAKSRDRALRFAFRNALEFQFEKRLFYQKSAYTYGSGERTGSAVSVYVCSCREYRF